MPEVIPHQHHQYRMQGGEIHRRPLSIRDDEPRWAAAWLVLNKDDDFIPPIVREQLSCIRKGERFD